MQVFNLIRPGNLDELRQLLCEEACGVIAGGTDLLPKWNRNHMAPDMGVWIDLTHLTELRFIKEDEDHIHIGALCTHSDLLESKLLFKQSPALIQAVSTIGCVQTRNRGTLGGNLANASPAADCAPPLLTLEATVNILTQQDIRHLPLESFFISPGQNALMQGEIIHSISFKKPTGFWGASFLKLGKRRAMAISIASVAAVLHLGKDGCVTKVRVAVGSLAPTPVRVKTAEADLSGKIIQPGKWHLDSETLRDDIHPIDDLRATAAYRYHAGVILIERTVEQAYLAAKRRF